MGLDKAATHRIICNDSNMVAEPSSVPRMGNDANQMSAQTSSSSFLVDSQTSHEDRVQTLGPTLADVMRAVQRIETQLAALMNTKMSAQIFLAGARARNLHRLETKRLQLTNPATACRTRISQRRSTRKNRPYPAWNRGS